MFQFTFLRHIGRYNCRSCFQFYTILHIWDNIYLISHRYWHVLIDLLLFMAFPFRHDLIYLFDDVWMYSWYYCFYKLHASAITISFGTDSGSSTIILALILTWHLELNSNSQIHSHFGLMLEETCFQSNTHLVW